MMMMTMNMNKSVLQIALFLFLVIIIIITIIIILIIIIMLYYNADKCNIQQLTIVGLPKTEQQLPRRTATVKHKALAHRPFVQPNIERD